MVLCLLGARELETTLEPADTKVQPIGGTGSILNRSDEKINNFFPSRHKKISSFHSVWYGQRRSQHTTVTTGP